MTARTFAQWVALGCPVTVKPDGRKAYLFSLTRPSLDVSSGMVVLSDTPTGAPWAAGTMLEHKISPASMDLVELDLRECDDTLNAGLCDEVLATRKPQQPYGH